jgi:hypothetical protein
VRVTISAAGSAGAEDEGVGDDVADVASDAEDGGPDGEGKMAADGIGETAVDAGPPVAAAPLSGDAAGPSGAHLFGPSGGPLHKGRFLSSGEVSTTCGADEVAGSFVPAAGAAALLGGFAASAAGAFEPGVFETAAFGSVAGELELGFFPAGGFGAVFFSREGRSLSSPAGGVGSGFAVGGLEAEAGGGELCDEFCAATAPASTKVKVPKAQTNDTGRSTTPTRKSSKNPFVIRLITDCASLRNPRVPPES